VISGAQTERKIARLMTGPLPYIGGKHRLAKRIVEIFPKHTTYVEGFAGGAQVFFHKEPSAVEVLNDLDGEIANFFRVCQRHEQELLRYLRFSIVSRTWFTQIAAQDPATLTDVQRAARFLYLQKNAFGGLVRKRSYHYHVVRPPSFDPGKLPQLIEKTHARLQRVQIECLSYDEIIRRFDRPTTLFYFDPPYWGLQLYRYNLSDADFVKMEGRLRAIQGKFVLSLNDVPEVRKLFRAYHLTELETPYTVQKTSGKRYRELLITNFKPVPRKTS